MNPLHTQIADVLRERLAVIADHELRQRDAAAHLEKLKDVSKRIQALQAQLGPETSPQLRHFLERSSYDKALALLSP